MYHMRINGDVPDRDLLASFDGSRRTAVSASLCGGFPDHSWWQGTRRVASGGFDRCATRFFCGQPHHVQPPCVHCGGT